MRRHLDAVLEASRHYDNIEYIVQDGQSTDATLDMLQSYVPKFAGKMKLVSEPDSSVAEAFLRALRRCSGSIICASLSDEELLPHAVARAVACFREHPEADVIHGDIYNTDLDGNITHLNPAGDFDLERYMSHQLPLHLAASFFRSEPLKRAVFSYSWGRVVDDFICWVRLAVSARIVHIPEVFAKYTVCCDQLSERPEVTTKLFRGRTLFLEDFLRCAEAPEAIRLKRREILYRFYRHAEGFLRSKQCLEESAFYLSRLDSLNRETAPPPLTARLAGTHAPAAWAAPLPGKDADQGPILSILCPGGNDVRLGNFAWLLSTVLNKHAENLVTLGLETAVEILVCDWRRDEPLQGTLELTEQARRLVKFLPVPPAQTAAGDCGGFSLSSAINAVARRARGKYLLFCDADVFLPLETLARLVYFLKKGYFHSFDLRNSFFWSSKFSLPDDYVAGTPYREHLEEHIRRNWTCFAHECVDVEHFAGPGACLLVSKEIWWECTGFDEGLGDRQSIAIDLTRRLLLKYRLDDLENHGVTVFQLGAGLGTGAGAVLEGGAGSNPSPEPAAFAPNPASWGLADLTLPVVTGFGLPQDEEVRPDPTGGLGSVRQIVATDPRYREISRRFPFDPHGFFCNEEVLNALLMVLQPRVVCEIGSWMGASARCLASAPSVARVVCIDHWDRYRVEKYRPGAHPERLMNNMYEQFLANAVHSGTDHKISPLRLDSHGAIEYCLRGDIRFDLIYVDGDHTTVGALADILNWSRLLNDGGYICGDDWTWQAEPNNVAGAAVTAAREKGWQIYFRGNFWLAVPGPFSVQPLTLATLLKIEPVVASGGDQKGSELPSAVAER